MTKREIETEVADQELPRPVVLRPEDLASIAGASIGLAQLPRLGGPIIAGGLPAGPTWAM